MAGNCHNTPNLEAPGGLEGSLEIYPVRLTGVRSLEPREGRRAYQARFKGELRRPLYCWSDPTLLPNCSPNQGRPDDPPEKATQRYSTIDDRSKANSSGSQTRVETLTFFVLHLS